MLKPDPEERVFVSDILEDAWFKSIVVCDEDGNVSCSTDGNSVEHLNGEGSVGGIGIKGSVGNSGGVAGGVGGGGEGKCVHHHHGRRVPLKVLLDLPASLGQGGVVLETWDLKSSTAPTATKVAVA
jgi:hypothetical protein